MSHARSITRAARAAAPLAVLAAPLAGSVMAIASFLDCFTI
jgi:hypothetical protein